MKKLMIAAVAMAAGAVFADGEITSQNIVGYMNEDSESKLSPSMGYVFMPVSGETFKLGDLKAEGMDVDSDCLQKLDPELTVAGEMDLYTYFSKEQAEDWGWDEWGDKVGWWAWGHVGDDGYALSNVTLKVGQGFLMVNGSRSQIKLNAAGEVPTTATQITYSEKSPMIANYLPVDMYLSDIVVEGMDVDSDCFQKLDPESTLAGDNIYTYFSKEQAEDWGWDEWGAHVGWWQWGHVGESGYSRNTVVFKAGEAYLPINANYTETTVKFKSALDVTPVDK